MVTYFSKNKLVHGLFEITIFAKGIHGIIDIAIGILFFFIKQETIYNALISATQYRLVKVSGHLTTNYLTKQADNFSISTQHFIAVYFLFYGIVNIFLVASLSKGKLWAYPAAIVFFSFFILYQFYRSLLHHSGLLFFLSVFDIFLVMLTWLEYKRVKKHIADESQNVL